MPSQRVLIAALVGAVSGYAVLRTTRAMVDGGLTIEDGGGWVALLIAEISCSLVAVAVALS
jgi:hypothetical protein